MKNWSKVKLGSLIKESKIVSKLPDPNKRLRVKLNVLGVEKRPNTKDKEGATKYYVRKAGQFIYGKQNLHKGAFGIIPSEFNGFESTLDIPAFDISELCYPEWVFYFFKKNNFYLRLEGLAKGVGSKRINVEELYSLDIYLPPLEEQKKILDEIKKLEGKNNDLLNEILVQEEYLEMLRAAILRDALDGSLTKKWRHKNNITESSLDLLKEIKVEKVKLIKKGKIKNEKVLPEIKNAEIPLEIPSNWAWCMLGDVITLKSGQDLKPGEYSDSPEIGIPYITGASNLKDEKVFVNRWTDYPKSVAFKGDLLITCKGSGVGKMGWLEAKSAHIARQIMAIQTVKSPIDFVKLVLDVNVASYRKNATGLIPGIDRKTILETIFALPPVIEQNEIVKKVNELKINSDLVEQEIIFRKESSKRLILSVLEELLGDENNIINKSISDEVQNESTREVKYNSRTTLMDLAQLLKENGKLHAEDLWKMSNYPDDIDGFYAELKIQIEKEKTIKESITKGYLELS